MASMCVLYGRRNFTHTRVWHKSVLLPMTPNRAYTNYVDINTDVLVTNEKSSNVTEAKVKSN